jgi:cytochrome P450
MEQYFESWVGKSLNAVDAAKEISFAIILDVVVGFDGLYNEVDEMSAARMADLYKTVQNAMFAPPINLPGTPFNRALKAREALLVEIENNLQKLVSKNTPAVVEGVAPNVASLLIDALDENGEKITLEQIKQVLFNMLDAGQETTGYTLASIIGSLARHPEALRQLREEQESIVAKYGDKLSSSVLQEMHFAEAVIKETLRNASPEPADRMRGITVIGIKRALKDFELGGYVIPAGYTIVTNSAYVTQHDSRWEDIAPSDPMAKTKFCPYRWLTKQGAQQSPEFMPFATGPRSCIGSTLAMAELKVALAVLARKYKWELVDPQKSNTWKSDPFPFPLDRMPIRFDYINSRA